MGRIVKQPIKDRKAWKKEYVHRTMGHYKVERAISTIKERISQRIKIEVFPEKYEVYFEDVYSKNCELLGEMPLNVQEAIKSIEAHNECKLNEEHPDSVKEIFGV